MKGVLTQKNRILNYSTNTKISYTTITIAVTEIHIKS